ncbi:immunoglobulin I-set domain protein [Ostertagia ostertagi]
MIKETSKEDFGSYRAVAKNTAGAAISTAKVSSKMTAPIFEQGLRRTEVVEREEIRLEAKITGTQPVVAWFKDGELIQEDQTREIRQDFSSCTYSLVIRESQCSDTGWYTVRATNTVGTRESSAEVKVTEITEKPSLVKGLVFTEVKLNETATMSVIVRGAPAPQVTWKKDGQPLTIDGTHITSTKISESEYSLSIHSCTLQDIGLYTCEATNTAGSVQSSANLAVKQEPEAPLFTKELQAIQIKESETVNLSVTVTGSPEPKVVWFKDDVPIEVDNVHILTREEGRGHFTLTIKDSQVTDIGSYSCKATNIAGEARTEATVNVTKEAVAPQFVEVLRPIHVKESETLNLSVTVTGSPEPKVVWFKDDVPIEVDNVHILTREEGRGHFTLTIKDSQVTDIGSYSCKATNIAGEARTEATVNVTKEAVAPQFVEVLRPIHVKESETLNLSVTVTGSPEPKVVWFKDDVPIEVDNVHILTREEGRGHFTLTIKDSQVTDIGSYSCKATNIAGEARTEATVNVTKEAVAPQFVEVLRPIHVKESETLNLSVTVTGSPEPKVVWFKDDVPIEVDNVHILTREEGRGHFTLTIKDSQVTDIGSYSCKATNIAGEARTEATVNVTKEAVAPQFVEVLRPIHVKESETLNLSVTVTGSPEPKVVWFKDDVPIEVDNVHILTREEGRGHFTLTIKDSQVTDIGSYSCKATNIAGEARTEATVNVTKEAVAPQFVEVLRPIHVKESETLNLSVTVTGSPEPKVVWFKDDVPIEVDNVHILTREEGRGHFTLTIKDSQVTDIGSYSCKATNIAGEARTEATVNVTKEAVAPQFVEVLRPIHVKESETLNLSVTVTGSPEPKVVWFKDDVPIEVDNVHILTREEGRGHFTLTIKDSQVTDIGSYSCKATNIAGEARTEATVNVTKEAVAPQFVEVLRPIHVKESETLNLSVTVTGSPEPKVVWFKDDVPIEVDNVHILTREEGRGHFTLTIKDSQVTDIGSYSCKATNIAGEARTEATVNVTKEAVAPQFVEVLRPIHVKESETLNLSVTVTGSPEPKVVWFKDDVPIEVDNVHILTREEGRGHFTLTIKDSQVTDIGSYSCKATNIAGEARTEATVNVTKEAVAPQFVEVLRPIHVKESETLNLSVTVTGSPEPKVVWFKDDVPIEVDNVHILTREEGRGHFTLTIKDSQVTDIGSYSCKATNIAGEARTEATVNVTKEAVAPQFVEVLRPIHVKESETLNLSVTVTGSPEPKVVWFKDDVPIEVDNVHILTREEGRGHFTLTIKDSQVTDIGSYSCKATNIAGEARTEATVNVTKEAVAPQFVEVLRPIHVKESETLNLSVTVTGSPEPKVVWFKDDVPIEVDNVHILTREEGRGHFTLTIKDSQVTDIGSYSCKATNIAGEARTEATVNVTKEAVAPQFVEVLRPIHVKESETLNLSVTVTGSPEPKVVWFKDDVPIEVDNVHILTREEGRGHFTLTIKDSQVTDIGSYSCKATNIAGEARTEATVNVTKEAVAPQFVEVLRPIHVKESETLNLSVTVTGSPEPKVVWFKDDVPIEVDNVHILTREEGRGHFTLTIKDSQVTDIGSYSCKATNIAGEARTEATVNVTKEAVAPQFVEVLRPIHVKESETLNLSVTVTGSPEPKVVWFKDDVPIEVDNVHILTREEGRGHFTLTIKDSQVTDIGSYSCKATNIAGEARTEATVNVTKEAVAPQFVEVLRPIHVKESETLNLSVTVTGSPEPKVVWFKDDVPIEVDNVHILTREEGRGHFTLTIKDSQKQLSTLPKRL